MLDQGRQFVESLGGDGNSTYGTFGFPSSGLRQLKPGTAYRYWVVTFGERGESWSKPLIVTTPGSVETPRAPAPGGHYRRPSQGHQRATGQ